MISSEGKHYIALDHIRALAAFIVFTWHFIHGENGAPIPFDYTPSVFPFALLDEGHTGVALFMTLSGYLFAKLINGRRIIYSTFIFNRAVRLLPLLAFVIFFTGCIRVLQGIKLHDFIHSVIDGMWLPTLPNGGWSVTVEFHFYLLLPLILWLSAQSRIWLVVIILSAMLTRALIFQRQGEVQTLAYWTIVGRIDQFALGMIAFHYRSRFSHLNGTVLGALSVFMLLYWGFDKLGGFFMLSSYPSHNPAWIFITTIEGTFYGLFIAWYDSSLKPTISIFSRFAAFIGQHSYSIYLLHYFFVFQAAKAIDNHIMDLSNFYVACAWSAMAFLIMLIPARISYLYLEAPFLKWRRPYIQSTASAKIQSDADATCQNA